VMTKVSSVSLDMQSKATQTKGILAVKKRSFLSILF